jgi:hypothetical protein
MDKYYGQYKYISAHLGNGVGITIEGSQLNGHKENVNLGFTMEKVPGFAQGFQTYEVTPYQSSKLDYSIDVHINVGEEYAGKTAYVFSRDIDTNTYERKEVVSVNEIGNVALHTDEVTDIIVLMAN